MKRFLSLFVTVAIILSFSLVTFAFEDEATIEVTSNLASTVAPGETVNVEFYFDAGDDLEVNGAYAGVRLYYPADLTLTGLADGGYGIFQAFPDKTDGSEKYIYFNGETEDTFVVKSNLVAMKASFVVPEEATNGTVYTFKTLAKSNNLDDMNDGGMATISDATFTTTVVVEGDEEEEPAEEPLTDIKTSFTTADNLTWEGIYTASYTKAFTGTKLSGSVELGYTKDGVAADAPKSVEISPLNGTFVNTEMTFTIAIVGVPSNVTINSVTPAIVAE